MFDGAEATIRWPAAWSARWIWSELPQLPQGYLAGGAPPRETWNRSCYLRREVLLASVPGTVPARVTADSRYILMVNGVEVSRGPARSEPSRLAYSSLDLAPYLRSGSNVVAALVRFYGRPAPWWVPATPSHQLGFGSFLFESPSIGVVSDGSWLGRPAPYRQEVFWTGERWRAFVLPPEALDGTGVPIGWAEPGYDASDWQPAVELSAGRLDAIHRRVPAEPFTSLEPDQIAPRGCTPVTLRLVASRTIAAVQEEDPILGYERSEVVTGDDGDQEHIYDAGRISFGTPWLAIDGERGAIVDLYAGEVLREDGRVEIRPRFYALRYQLAGGAERVEGFDPLGCRYLAAVAHGRARIVEIGLNERTYPVMHPGSFHCDDERLNRIWSAGARTLELCATDAFVDCPGREARAWVGDSYIHALLTYVTNSDWRLVRRHLRLCAQFQRRDGLLAMAVGSDLALSPTTIPDYSLHWIRALAAYWQHSGDEATVGELLPVAAGIVAACERWRAEDGLLRAVPGWVFVDWAPTERAEVIGALDALYAAALSDYAVLLRVVLRAEDSARRAERLADLTRRAFQALWDERRGVYVDAADAEGSRRRVSQQTNAIAILGGCAPPARWSRILSYILDPARLFVAPTDDLLARGVVAQWADPAALGFDTERQVIGAQPFFAHFVHQAVVAAGLRGRIPELCLQWWPQLERGGTALAELWEGPPAFMSRVHAWSATPTYDLTTHVLGVRPIAPGYHRAAIRPQFGAWQRLAGRVPTPHGTVELDLSPHGGLVTVPDGVTALFAVGGPSPSAVRRLGPGRHRLAL